MPEKKLVKKRTFKKKTQMRTLKKRKSNTRSLKKKSNMRTLKKRKSNMRSFKKKSNMRSFKKRKSIRRMKKSTQVGGGRGRRKTFFRKGKGSPNSGTAVGEVIKFGIVPDKPEAGATEMDQKVGADQGLFYQHVWRGDGDGDADRSYTNCGNDSKEGTGEGLWNPIENPLKNFLGTVFIYGGDCLMPWYAANPNRPFPQVGPTYERQSPGAKDDAPVNYVAALQGGDRPKLNLKVGEYLKRIDNKADKDAIDNFTIWRKKIETAFTDNANVSVLMPDGNWIETTVWRYQSTKDTISGWDKTVINETGYDIYYSGDISSMKQKPYVLTDSDVKLADGAAFRSQGPDTLLKVVYSPNFKPYFESDNIASEQPRFGSSATDGRYAHYFTPRAAIAVHERKFYYWTPRADLINYMCVVNSNNCIEPVKEMARARVDNMWAETLKAPKFTKARRGRGRGPGGAPPQLWRAHPGTDPYTVTEATKDIASAHVVLTWFLDRVQDQAVVRSTRVKAMVNLAETLAATYHEWWEFQKTRGLVLKLCFEDAAAAGGANATLVDWVDEFHAGAAGNDPMPKDDMKNALLGKPPVEIVGIFRTLFEQYYKKCASFNNARAPEDSLTLNLVYRWGDHYTVTEATKDIESAHVALTWFTAHDQTSSNRADQDQVNLAETLAATYHEWWVFEPTGRTGLQLCFEDAAAAGGANATLVEWVNEFHGGDKGNDPMPKDDMKKRLLGKPPVEIVVIFRTLFEQYYKKCASFFTAEGPVEDALDANDVYRWGQVDPA